MDYQEFFIINKNSSLILVDKNTKKKTKISLETLFEMFSRRLVDDITTSRYRSLDNHIKSLSEEEGGLYFGS